MDRQRLKQVEKIEGVSDAYGSYSAYGVEVSEAKIGLMDSRVES